MLFGINADANRDVVEDASSPPDDVFVPKGEWVEAPDIDGVSSIERRG